MAYHAVKEQTQYNQDSVVNRLHPPVIVTKTIADGVGAFDKGTILAKTDDGIKPMVAYDPDADPQQVIVGVATSDFDPAIVNMVEAIVHGTVTKEMLLADDDQIALLTSQLPIYAV